MRWARGLVLFLAVGAGIGAGVLVRKSMLKEPETRQKTEPAKLELLVLRHPVAAGEMVTAGDLRWQPWPASAVPAGTIRRHPGAPTKPFEPALARYPLLEGEPILSAKLVRSGEGSTIAALMQSGKRAVAVPVQEDSAVGGLIQPGDRVDVLWTERGSDHRPNARPITRTILSGVKVLAIGKSLHASGKSANGRTATLELTPDESRIIASARAGGELLLALIPAMDTKTPSESETVSEWDADPTGGVAVMKFGQRSAASIGQRGR